MFYPFYIYKISIYLPLPASKFMCLCWNILGPVLGLLQMLSYIPGVAETACSPKRGNQMYNQLKLSNYKGGFLFNF